MQKWRENINTLNTALRREADKTKCDTTTSGSVNPAFVNYIGTVVPLNSSVSLMKEIYGLSSSGTDFFSEVDNFLDPAGPVMELKSHTDFIEDVERSIIETAQYVWSHCAQSVRLKDDILAGKSGYITTQRTIGEVMVDMAKQTKQVKRFLQILSRGIQTEEYIDEVPFLIAPPWFSKEMYIYYSPKYIQECRDSDPRKKAFMEVLKWAFTSGWKYPQAVQVWKDAMALLLYRGSQVVWSGAYDANKESEISRLVQARKGGIGNSDITINSQFFKEFWYRPDSQTVDEKQAIQENKTFYTSIGYEFLRKVIPSIVLQAKEKNTNYIKSNQTQEETQKIQRLQILEESLYTQYGSRREQVALSKQNDPKQSSDLAQTIQDSRETQDTLKKIYNGNICPLSREQATNVNAWRC